MHPMQIFEVKQEVLRSDVSDLKARVARLLRIDDPEKQRESLERLNA
jgi:phosphotransferase system enzyme I (PtsI)